MELPLPACRKTEQTKETLNSPWVYDGKKKYGEDIASHYCSLTGIVSGFSSRGNQRREVPHEAGVCEATVSKGYFYTISDR